MERMSPRSVVPSATAEWPGRDLRNLRQTLLGTKRSLDECNPAASRADWPGKPLKPLKQTTLVLGTRVADTSNKVGNSK